MLFCMNIVDYLLLPLRVARQLIEQADWMYYAYHGRTFADADFGDGFWVPRWMYIPIAFVVSFVVVEASNIIRLITKLVKKCLRQSQN